MRGIVVALMLIVFVVSSAQAGSMYITDVSCDNFGNSVSTVRGANGNSITRANNNEVFAFDIRFNPEVKAYLLRVMKKDGSYGLYSVREQGDIGWNVIPQSKEKISQYDKWEESKSSVRFNWETAVEDTPNIRSCVIEGYPDYDISGGSLHPIGSPVVRVEVRAKN